MAKTPKIFVGSSSESIKVAKVIQSHLQKDAKIKVWSDDVFQLSQSYLESLNQAIRDFDFAIFVLGAEDIVSTRGSSHKITRDNVLFEFGLFSGRIGTSKTFAVYDSNNKPYILSDLNGIEFAEYDGSNVDDLRNALNPACTRIRNAIKNYNKKRNSIKDTDIELLRAILILTKLKPPAKISDTLSQIIAKQHVRLENEFEILRTSQDWDSLLATKKILREFFEYTGLYREGVEIGEVYLEALDALEDEQESIWTLIKHIGYLLILAEEHDDARKALEEAQRKISKQDEKTMFYIESNFYCNRYLGVSYHRDQNNGNIDKAIKYFNEAESFVEKSKKSPLKYKEMKARLLGNIGNIAVTNQRYNDALNYFQQSHNIFSELQDREHIGISYLQIVEALIPTGKDEKSNKEIEDYLEKAFNIFIGIGWIEGLARTTKYFAKYYEKRSLGSRSSKQKISYLEKANSSLIKSRAWYSQIKLERQIGRVDEHMLRINEKLSKCI